MSWLDDILFAPIKWALPDELEKKLNPVFDAVGAVGSAALQKWDSAAADVVKIGQDSCELAGAKDVAKVLGKVAQGVELVGGRILKASEQALAAKASDAMMFVPKDASKKAAGAAGAVATRDGEKFFECAKMGDALGMGDDEIA